MGATEEATPVGSKPGFAEGSCQAWFAKGGWADGAGEKNGLVVAATAPAHLLLFLPVN